MYYVHVNAFTNKFLVVFFLWLECFGPKHTCHCALSFFFSNVMITILRNCFVLIKTHERNISAKNKKIVILCFSLFFFLSERGEGKQVCFLSSTADVMEMKITSRCNCDLQALLNPFIKIIFTYCLYLVCVQTVGSSTSGFTLSIL